MNDASLTPFHLAIPVTDIAAAREFYGGLLACPEGRSADLWVDFNLFGHQLVCHQLEAPNGFDDQPGEQGQSPARKRRVEMGSNPVDGDQVPVPHFGVVLQMDQWRALAQRLSQAGVQFVIEPHVRFAGEPGEQATMFFRDPSGNCLEFKAFSDIDDALFCR